MVRTKATTKQGKGEKKRQHFIPSVDEEVTALLPASRRKDAEHKEGKFAGPHLCITFHPGVSTPPSHSDEVALEEDFAVISSFWLVFNLRRPLEISSKLGS